MLTLIISVGAGVLSGAASGVLAARVAPRRTPTEFLPPTNVTLDPLVDQMINERASQWAEGIGHPEAGDLIANKLRLTYDLGNRRQRRRAWWSR